MEEQDIKFIIQKREEGLTLVDIAELSGFPKDQIAFVLREAGLGDLDHRFKGGKRSERFTDERVFALYRRVQSGERIKDVAESVNITPEYLRKLFVMHKFVEKQPALRFSPPKNPKGDIADLTPDELFALIVDMRHRQYTLKEIAEYIGRSIQYVANHLQRLGEENTDLRTTTGKRSDRWTDERIKVLRDRHQDGESYESLGREYGVTGRYVKYLIEQLDKQK